MAIWQELKRRNVVRVAAAYLVASWLIVQVILALAEPLSLPGSLDTVVVVLLAIGFPFALLAAWAFEVTPEGVRRTANVDDGATAQAVRAQRLNLIVTVLLALIVVVMAVDRFYLADAPGDARTETVSVADGPRAVGDRQGPPYRMTVLPLRSVSLDPDDQIFADGLTLALISRLGAIDGLELTAGTSSFAVAERAATTEAIGEELKVDYLLEGDLRADPEMLEIQIRLVRTLNGSFDNLGSYNRTRGEILALQNDIAQEVSEQLAVELGVTNATANDGATIDAAAYGAYLRGRALRSQFAVPAAVAQLERAVELDPAFGLAWVELAYAYDQLVFSQLDRIEALENLERNAVDRALELMPDRREPHALLAYQLSVEGNWLGAASEFDVARASPGDTTSGQSELALGAFLHQVGKQAEALPYYIDLRSRDPLSVDVSGQTAWALDLAGRNADSLREFDRHRGLTGGEIAWFAQYLHAALVSGEPAEIERAVFDSGFDDEFKNAWPDPADSRAWLRASFVAPEPESLGSSALFMAAWSPVAAYLGDVDLALDIVERAYFELGDRATIYLWHALMADVRRTDRFKALVADLGLPEYWREYGWPDHCRPLNSDDFECE